MACGFYYANVAFNMYQIHAGNGYFNSCDECNPCFEQRTTTASS